MKKLVWHNSSEEDIFEVLHTDRNGLTSEEVSKRLERYGKNELPQKKRTSVLKILWEEIIDPIVLLLIVTVLFSFFIGEVVDACAIIFIIFVDLILGTVQEWNAERNAMSLASLIKVHCNVIRNHHSEQIDSRELVIGDIVELESGDKISADLRILDCHNFQVDEAVLTGESLAVQKQIGVIKEKTSLAERKNIIRSAPIHWK